MASQGSEAGEPTAKRRRIGLACNACRLRKTKCNGNRPTCSMCQAFNFDCHYEPSEPSANMVVRKEYVSDLEHRVVALEGLVQRLDDTLRGHLAGCIENSRVTPIQAVHAPSNHPTSGTIDGALSCASNLEEPHNEAPATDGMAMTFVDERTATHFGESSNISFIRLLLRSITTVRQSARGLQGPPDPQYTVVESNTAAFSQTQTISSSPLKSDQSPLMTLPPQKEMDDMLAIYFRTTGMLFPFIHEPTFRATYADCCQNNFTQVRRTWLAVINMVFAHASNYNPNGAMIAKMRVGRSDVFYQRATSLCGDMSKPVMNLEIIHYLLLVVLYCQGTQRSVQAWNMHGFLVRSAMALGMHVDRTEHAADPLVEESRRRTWITIYTLDKVLSMTFGRPAAIADEYMTSRQPTTWPSLSSDAAQGDSYDLAGECLGYSFRLYQVMGRSLVRQYGANMAREDLELDEIASLQAAGEFRKALRVWASSLPAHLSLCDAQSQMLHEKTSANRLRVILTLRYDNVCILVHRPLLGSTLRHLFHEASTSSSSQPYMIQLTMAEAHECIRSAESTIEIVSTVLAGDRSSSSNLGVWFFTLYYVFTASLVVCGRLLWARCGQTTADEAAITHAELLLGKVQSIFEGLDLENALVSSCASYIRSLSEMKTPHVPMQPPDKQLASSHSAPADMQQGMQAFADGYTSEGVTMPATTLEPQLFPFLTSEIFDPSIFEESQPMPDQSFLENIPWQIPASRM